MPKTTTTKTTTTRKKTTKKLSVARVYLKARQNNSIVTLTDINGAVLAWTSAGKAGFKGTRKSTPFAAQKATEEIIEKAKELGVSQVHLIINGGAMGRDAFIRSFQASDLTIDSIKDTTGFPFGGVRQKQERKN